MKKKFHKIFKYWSDLSIDFQFQSFHRVYGRNWLNSKFCGGGPQFEPKPTNSGENLLILWKTMLPIAAQLMSRHCNNLNSWKIARSGHTKPISWNRKSLKVFHFSKLRISVITSKWNFIFNISWIFRKDHDKFSVKAEKFSEKFLYYILLLWLKISRLIKLWKLNIITLKENRLLWVKKKIWKFKHNRGFRNEGWSQFATKMMQPGAAGLHNINPSFKLYDSNSLGIFRVKVFVRFLNKMLENID